MRSTRVYVFPLIVISLFTVYMAAKTACTWESDTFEDRASALSSFSRRRGDCYDEFVSYASSDLELFWHEHIAEYQDKNRAWPRGCAQARKDVAKFEKWLETRKALSTNFDVAKVDYSIFSTFTYKNTCTNEKRIVPIEPLASYLRHPITTKCFTDVPGLSPGLPVRPYNDEHDKDYLVVAPLPKTTHNERKFYFDLGCSTYDAGLGGASLSWFIDTYASQGIEFDRIFAWEMTRVDPKTFWKHVPERVKRKLSYFNIPVVASAGSPDNPLEYILKETTPSDFVVLKIDIDHPETEIALIQRILDEPRLALLIDEMFWEHHTEFSPMSSGWANFPMPDDQEMSYNYFEQLRKMGIRIHSWV